MADVLRLPEKWRRGVRPSLRLKCFPRGTLECPQPHVVFVIVFTGGARSLVSNRSFVKRAALEELDFFLALLKGDDAPRDIKKLRKGLRDRIRRYKCLPEYGRGSGGAGSIGHSTGTH